jgi:NRAMP (natural resistance-associated macrophage protein)-like metal ion transporter
LQRSRQPSWLSRFGPGFLTGAADDDPSGIGTYAEAGARFGVGMLWTLLLAFPLMAAIQEICARVGRVTGRDLATNIREECAPCVFYLLLALLAVSNVLNIAADLGAMGAATSLVIGGAPLAYAVAFAVVSLLLATFVAYRRYSRILMVFTISLLAYVVTAAVVDVAWAEAIKATFMPRLRFDGEAARMVVAVLGTTISPYLFFWQAAQEVEEIEASPRAQPLVESKATNRAELHRIRVDTIVGMGVSNLVGWFIMLTSATTLHVSGVREIGSPEQAAAALAPLAGSFAGTIFAAGIVGTGLLAIPVLAGSVAYAAGAAFGFPVGLGRTLREAPFFYLAIAASFAGGVTLSAALFSPMKALVYAATINGVAAVPIMFVVMRISSRRETMGKYRNPRLLAFLGWTATAFMAAASFAMLAVVL